MKCLIYLVLAGITINSACAQNILIKHEWKATLQVVDDDGRPVANAKAGVSYYFNHTGASIDGLTDTNGIFTASHSAYSGILGFAVGKPGYYTTRQEYDLGFTYDHTKWNPTPIIVLKKITNPIPMYVKRIHGGPAVTNQPAGFDLMIGDWVAPNGKGVNADIIFTKEFNKQSASDYDRKLMVSFPNTGDGIQEFQVPFKMMEGSILRSSHEVPADGYKPNLIRLSIHHSGQPQIWDFDENRSYYFRVHTVLDENGNVKSALYGKIYGDFMRFSYYLNPTPNDRNVEFDPSKNLIKDLKPLEQVKEP